MSARREHRLRSLERRMEALEGKTDFLSMRQDHNEIRIFEMQRIQAEIRLPTVQEESATRIPAQSRPLKGILQRITDFFGGR